MASEVDCKVVEGLVPEACDEWPKVQLEASVKCCSPGLGSVGPTLFNVLLSDVGSGRECPLSKLSDDAESGGVAEAPDGCATIQRELERLENGAERSLLQFNRGKCKDLHLGRNSAGHQDMLGAERLESSFAEHDFVVLVENKLTTRQQRAPGAKEAKSLQGGIGKSVASRSGEVISLSLQGW